MRWSLKTKVSVAMTAPLAIMAAAKSVNISAQKPADFSQFQETVIQLSSYWLDVSESPPVGVKESA